MLEYVGSVLLLPAACAVVAMLVLRIRVPPLSLIGAGHAGSVLATVARGVLDVPAFPRLGLFDPFLWVTTGSVLVLAAARWREILRRTRGAGRV